MRHKSTGDRGSAHVVIIAVLSLLLVGALGMVFYQNFIAKKTNTSDQHKPATTPVAATKTTQIAFNSTIYELDYPKDWTVTTTKLEASRRGGTSTAITNPDKTMQVTFHISELGVGGACDNNDGLKISHYKVYPQAVKTLTDMPLYLVETMSDHTGGGYDYKIGLTLDGGDTHAIVGDSHCNIAHVGLASAVLTSNGQLEKPTLMATIDFPRLPAGPEAAAKDMQEIRDFLKTSDYTKAREVLESTRKKS